MGGLAARATVQSHAEINGCRPPPSYRKQRIAGCCGEKKALLPGSARAVCDGKENRRSGTRTPCQARGARGSRCYGQPDPSAGGLHGIGRSAESGRPFVCALERARKKKLS